MAIVHRELEIEAAPSITRTTWDHFLVWVRSAQHRLACDELACTDAVGTGAVRFEGGDHGGTRVVVEVESDGGAARRRSEPAGHPRPAGVQRLRGAGPGRRQIVGARRPHAASRRRAPQRAGAPSAERGEPARPGRRLVHRPLSHVSPGLGEPPRQDAERGGAARRPAPLRAASFNIRNGLALDGADSWPFRAEACAQAIAGLDADLVCLQEVYGFQLRRLLRRLPGYAAAGAPRDDGRRRGERCCVLYRPRRLRLRRADTRWYSDTPDVPGSRGWGAAMPRIATMCRFRDWGAGSGVRRGQHPLGRRLGRVTAAQRRGAPLLARPGAAVDRRRRSQRDGRHAGRRAAARRRPARHAGGARRARAAGRHAPRLGRLHERHAHRLRAGHGRVARRGGRHPARPSRRPPAVRSLAGGRRPAPGLTRSAAGPAAPSGR